MAGKYDFHELRKFASTQLREQGADDKLRSHMVLGHADSRITNSTYTPLTDASLARAAESFDPLAVARSGGDELDPAGSGSGLSGTPSRAGTLWVIRLARGCGTHDVWTHLLAVVVLLVVFDVVIVLVLKRVSRSRERR